MNRIEKNGFSAALMNTFLHEFFAAEAFISLDLTDPEICFAVYRVILTRDPTASEIASFKSASLSEEIDRLTETAEFKKNITSYTKDRCKWGVNNNTLNYTGSKVYTAKEINQMLLESDVVSLPQCALVLCDEVIQIKPGKTLQTEGNPTCYLKMARFLRTVADGWAIVECANDVTVTNIWLDGNRSGIGTGDGSNCWGAGGNTNITYNKMSDTIAPSNMLTVCGYSNILIAHNLITCYTSSNAESWTDGITHQANAVIEYNAIIDATDVADRCLPQLGRKAKFDHPL